MHPVRITLALLSALALPAIAHASTIDFTATGSADGFSGSGTLITTANTGGSYTITGISGPFGASVIAPGGFDANDNLLFPGTSSLLDTHGFAFSATQGDTSFMVDIFSTGAGAYAANFLDNDGFSATIPISFAVSSTTSVIPEPSSLLLLGTGILGLAGLIRRRLIA